MVAKQAAAMSAGVMLAGAFSSMNAVARRRLAGWGIVAVLDVGAVSALTKTARAVAMSRRGALAANRGCPAGRAGRGRCRARACRRRSISGRLRREGSYLEWGLELSLRPGAP